jgi:hypothetical protein
VLLFRFLSKLLKLVHSYRRLALTQIDDVLCLHVDLSVPRITRHFFPDPTREVEFAIFPRRQNTELRTRIQSGLVHVCRSSCRLFVMSGIVVLGGLFVVTSGMLKVF